MTKKHRNFTILPSITTDEFQTTLLSLAHVFKGHKNIILK